MAVDIGIDVGIVVVDGAMIMVTLLKPGHCTRHTAVVGKVVEVDDKYASAPQLSPSPAKSFVAVMSGLSGPKIHFGEVVFSSPPQLES